MEKNKLLLLNFRGFIIEVEEVFFKKLPKESEFSNFIQSKYGKTLNSLFEDELPSYQIYLNRNGFMFYNILDYLEIGQLHFAHNICSDLILDELEFWGLEPHKLSICCLDRLLKDKEECTAIGELKGKWEALERSDQMVHPGERQRSKLHSGKAKDLGDLDKAEKQKFEENLVRVTKIKSNRKTSKIRDVILNPTSCLLAKLYCCLVILAVVLSVLVVLLETEPSLREKFVNNPVQQADNDTRTSTRCDTVEEGRTWAHLTDTRPKRWLIAMDVLTTSFLTIDFLARLILTHERRRFLCSALTIIDILSIIPVWIGLGIALYLDRTGSLSKMANVIKYVSILRVLRVFRFWHITLHNRQLRLIGLGMRSSWKEFLVLFFIISMYSSLFGILAFYIEVLSGKDSFQSGIDGVYWAIITMTTVGYGDYYPITDLGKVLAITCCLVGIVVIAMATTILVNTFFTVYQTVQKLDRLSEVKYEELLAKTKPVKHSVGSYNAK